MLRTQLLEVEAKLKSTLAALQERSLQYEELMDSHQCLRYRPCSPPPLEPLHFGKSSSSWGVGDKQGARLQSLRGCPGGWKRLWGSPADPILGEAA